MIKFSLKRVLPYSNKQMYDIVIDIKKYPEFLPWCISAEEYGSNRKKFKAELEIGFNHIKESFLSEITPLYPYRIISKAISGPFRILMNEWEFTEKKNNTCEVELNIEFQFKSMILHNLIGKVFEYSSKKMINAFEERAKQLYEKEKIL